MLEKRVEEEEEDDEDEEMDLVTEKCNLNNARHMGLREDLLKGKRFHGCFKVCFYFV